METFFGPEFFAGNRQKLRRLFAGTAPIVLSANGLVQRNADTTLAFRQDSDFWYLTGINEPGLILVMDKTKDYLILPERNSLQDIFDGHVEADKLSKISGLKTVLGHNDGWKQLNTRLKKSKHFATVAVGPIYNERHGFYLNPAKTALYKHIKDANAHIKPLDLRQHLTKMRAIKQPSELAAMRSAVDITAATLKAILKKLSKYNYEYEIEGDITRSFRKLGAFGHSYTPIVASGLNACTLHYVANDAQLGPKQLLLIDAGAEVSNYAADISRTYATSQPSKRQRAVHSAVLEVQNHALALLKPGVSLRDYEGEVENIMGEKLRSLGLIKSINQKNVRKYYPHSTSHFLGLDAHDVGNYDMALEPGMVITVEPGIYIPEESLGVRLEDDVLITTKGVKVLSRGLPRTLT